MLRKYLGCNGKEVSDMARRRKPSLRALAEQSKRDFIIASARAGVAVSKLVSLTGWRTLKIQRVLQQEGISDSSTAGKPRQG